MEFDYIIIGAGSAGCVLAERLSADARNTVAIVEAGSDQSSWKINWPIGYGSAFTDPKLNWCYETIPDDQGRKHYVPRGKVIGGSSAINAMVYTRGFANDYNDWAKIGNPNWNASIMQEAFEAIECDIPILNNSSHFHEISWQFIKAAQSVGYIQHDLKAPLHEGVGAYEFTIKNGRRASAADVFLLPALKRKNITLIANSEVSKLVFEGTKAIGAFLASSNSIIKARRGVIISAGAINSPKLLLQSGIGDGAELQKFGINCLVDNPNVGKHMQDHFAVSYHFASKRPTLNNILGHWFWRNLAGLQYILTRKGPLSMSVNQMGGFIGGSSQAPEFQLYFNPLSFDRNEIDNRNAIFPSSKPGFVLSIGGTRPKSHGEITLASPHSSTPPLIDFKYFSNEADEQSYLRGLSAIKKIVKSQHFQNIAEHPLHIDLLTANDDALLIDAKNRGGTVFHNCGTVRMAPKSNGGVVNENLMVYGTENLFVCDASIFPNISSGNTNAPTMAVAHIGAQKIKKAH